MRDQPVERAADLAVFEHQLRALVVRRVVPVVGAVALLVHRVEAGVATARDPRPQTARIARLCARLGQHRVEGVVPLAECGLSPRSRSSAWIFAGVARRARARGSRRRIPSARARRAVRACRPASASPPSRVERCARSASASGRPCGRAVAPARDRRRPRLGERCEQVAALRARPQRDGSRSSASQRRRSSRNMRCRIVPAVERFGNVGMSHGFASLVTTDDRTRSISACTSATSASGRSRYFAHSCGMCAMSLRMRANDGIDRRRDTHLARGPRNRAVEYVDLGAMLRAAQVEQQRRRLCAARARDARAEHRARERARHRRDRLQRAHADSAADRSALSRAPASRRALRASRGSPAERPRPRGTSRSGSTLRIAHDAFATTLSASFDHFSER